MLTASRDLRAVIHGRGTLAGTPLGFPGNHESSKHHHLTYVMDPRDEGSEKDSGLSYFLNLEASSLRSPFLSFLLPLSLSLSDSKMLPHLHNTKQRGRTLSDLEILLVKETRVSNNNPRGHQGTAALFLSHSGQKDKFCRYYV